MEPDLTIKEKIRNVYFRKKKLMQVHLDLTYRCNLRCVHCYVNKEVTESLDTRKVLSIIDELYEMGTFRLTFSGGDPLLREDLFDIIKYARQKKFAITVKTTGMLIDEKAASCMAAIPVNLIDMTVFSDQPEVHDSITAIHGSCMRAFNAIELLKKHRVHVRAMYPIIKNNVDSVQSVMKRLDQSNIDYLPSFSITPKTDGSLIPYDYAVEPAKRAEVYLKENVFKKKIRKVESNRIEYRSNDILCFAGHTLLYISPDGTVYPCVNWPVVLGNVRQCSIKEIWNNSDALRIIKSLTFNDRTECFSCSLLEFCSFCPGTSYIETGKPAGCAAGLKRDAEGWSIAYQTHQGGRKKRTSTK
jgi:radical SAM protein with 4Fe4S-binding SPASM domain